MTGLELTAERRGELAALLDNEQRLRAEYPKVADYLDMAPRLSGTRDKNMDAAFDLRFVHYMTGGQAANGNPYWDIVGPAVFDFHGRREVNCGDPAGSSRLGYAEMILQETYAYAVPSPQTIEWVCGFCRGQPVVELGAGRGYWAAQLSQSGLKVDAYDVKPPDAGTNPSFTQVSGQNDVWYRVRDLEDFERRSFGEAGYVLFLCWPPGWGDEMASHALARFEQAGGERLVFIGEPKGGKTGDDAFFEALSAHWRLDAQDKWHVSWWNVSDVAQGWVRR